MNQVMSIGNIDWSEIILVFVLAAEQYIKGTKKGAERKEWVINKFYDLLPDILTQFVSREMLSELIEKAVVKMKEKLIEESND